MYEYEKRSFLKRFVFSLVVSYIGFVVGWSFIYGELMISPFTDSLGREERFLILLQTFAWYCIIPKYKAVKVF